MDRLLIYALLCSLFSFVVLGFAQDADEDDQEVFDLNPFEVDESADLGYSATNTLSGTRFNSSLRDTSASVSVWTQEFIDDTGLTDIDELIDYSLNTVLDTNDQDGAGGNFNVFTNATAVTQRIRTRGIESSRGIDYFKSIIPDDSYKIGRYDDSRGPNGVLFGVSNAGGLINQTSLVANTYQDSGRVRYSFGTASRDRAEFRYNKVLIEDKLAIVLAAMNQDNGFWRDWISDDKERAYVGITWRPNEKITFRANYEDGFHHKTSIQQGPITDRALPYYDHLQASGLDGLTFNPYRGNGQGARVTNATRAVGVGARDANPRNGTNSRFTFIENDNSFHNLAGTFNTVGYNNRDVFHPDGSPGYNDFDTSRTGRINDQSVIPYHYNPGGPDFYRETDFDMYSAFLDVQITDNWFFNVQFGKQSADIDVPQLQGTRPEFRFDPNTVQSAIDPYAPANPFVGQPYFDGDYRRDKNISRYEEIRASTSYNLDTGSNWLGRHRIAVAASRVDETQRRGNTWLSLGGNPSGAGTFLDTQGNTYDDSNYLAANNRLTIRNYYDFDDRSTWKAGSWRNAPTTVSTDRFTPGVQTSYPVVWAESQPGNINYLISQVTESRMAVIQSHFWDDRLVFTYGYREDDVVIDRAGHFRDPVIGWIPDLDIGVDTTSDNNTIPGAPQTNFDGTVSTAGAVFHLTENISLVANSGSNIGVPDFRRTVFPDGATSPPPDGDGQDFGIDFSMFDNRVNGRVVYYQTEAIQEVVGGSQASGPMEAIYLAFEEAFAPAVDPYGVEIPGSGNASALSDLLSRRNELRPEVNGRFRDNVSDGIEFRLTANITDNWRLQLNASKTDRIVSNSFSKAIDFLGLTRGEDGLLVQGVRETDIPDPDPDAEPGDTIPGFVIENAGAYESGKVISELLAYGSQLTEGQTINNTPEEGENSIAGEVWGLVDSINDQVQIAEKRWGLRPYRVNLFSTYDFKEGFLKGWSLISGYRWSSANIIGEENGIEVEGEPLSVADLGLRYRTARGAFFGGDGRWTFQLNVQNALNNRNIIPSRLAIDGNTSYQVPGNRGIAYARFDLPVPRMYRFTVTYDF
jgi:hypothetical protein